MTENKRYRVFKYPDCEEYGVSDDVAEYTLARFDNHFEAEGLCELLNELHEENQEFRKRTKELIAVSLDYPTINLDLMAEAIKSLRELILNE